MDMGKSTSEKLDGWSDMVSMILLGLALLAGDLTPKRPIWGRPPARVVAMTVAMLALVIWTGFRVIYEGINTQGPREFLAGSIVYLARWLYLMLRFSDPRFREARMFQVARALRKVHNLRAGKSTDGPPENATAEERNARTRNYGLDADTRQLRIRNRGDWDVVVRQGVKKAADRTRHFWRGFIDPEPKWYPAAQAWDVSLREEGMHHDKLDIFGTIALRNDFEAIGKAYSQFYKVVLTAVPSPRRQEGVDLTQGNSSTITAEEPGSSPTAVVPRIEPIEEQSGSASVPSPQSCVISMPEEGSTAHSERTHPVEPVQPTGDAQEQPQQEQIQRNQRPEVDVNFDKFTSQWSGLPPEFIANSVDATDMRQIGFVARRIAADAVAYVENYKYDFRTPRQVDSLNECLDDARIAQFSAFGVEVAPAQREQRS